MNDAQTNETIRGLRFLNPRWSQQDYVMVAGVIRDRLGNNQPQCENLAGAFAAVFSKDNPRFRREKFLKACGVVF